MKKLNCFLLIPFLLLAYNLLMPNVLYAQGFTFPIDNHGWAYVLQIGNILQIIGTTRLSEPPPVEELIEFEGDPCAHSVFTGAWDCQNPVHQSGYHYLVFTYRFQIYFDPGCKGEICAFSPQDPTGERLCFSDDQSTLAYAEIRDAFWKSRHL